MKKFLFVFIIIILISCGKEPIIKFDVVGLYEKHSTLVLYKVSTYMQLFDENGESKKEFGQWKGSYEPDSTLQTYIVLEDGSWLGSSTYENIKDTLRLTGFSIR
jgi:hypothetical protein